MGVQTLTILLCLIVLGVVNGDRGQEVVGYWQDWVNTDWWNNNIPGNCAMGCAQAGPFISMMRSYSQVNFGFTFLSENPLPKQDSCDNSSALCPVWDGIGIYAAASYKQGSTVVNDQMDIHSINNSPGIIQISEVCRLARQGLNPPRRCLISFGGWSDWARLGSISNAQKAAKLAAKMVLLSFADGIDLDFEHLAEYTQIDPIHSEYDNFNMLVKTLYQEFQNIDASVWRANAMARYNDLQSQYSAMPDWQKSQSPYYPTNMKYMQDLIKNGPPKFSISWTTRFNAFINKTSPHNYLDPSSPVPPPFLTDDEGKKIWPIVGDYIDSVNIMAYDGASPVGPLKFNFQQILLNFKAMGPKASQVNMGFEPGNQYAGAVWEGFDKDKEVATFIKANNFGGAMVWAINPDPAVEPQSAQWVPVVASALNQIIQPKWPYGKTPVFTPCDPNSGWIN